MLLLPLAVGKYDRSNTFSVGRGTIAPGLETWGMYRPDHRAT
jgi:hypothetical protein